MSRKEGNSSRRTKSKKDQMKKKFQNKMKSVFIWSVEEGDSDTNSLKNEAYMCLMTKDTSTSEDEDCLEVETYDLLQTNDILQVLKEIEAIEQGNAKKMLRLQERAKDLEEDDDAIAQEINILAQNYQEKDNLVKGFKKCILKLDSKERALREIVKLSQNQE